MKRFWMWLKQRIRQWLLRLHLRRATIYYIGGNDTLPASLTPEKERELLQALGRGDAQARAQLIEHNLRLVVYVARRFDNTRIGIEDLISIGTIGLIKAVNTFDVTKKIKLATYASRCIENEILMFLRKTGKTRFEVSFDEPLNTDFDGNELLLSDVMGTDADLVSRDLEADADKMMLHKAIEGLSGRERHIVTLRYGLLDGVEKTQKQVADMLGISQSYISRLEKRIMQQLKLEISRMA